MRGRYGAVRGGVLADKSCRGDGGGRTVYDSLASAGTIYKVIIPDVSRIRKVVPDTNYGDNPLAGVDWATGGHAKSVLYADLSAYNGRTVLSASLVLTTAKIHAANIYVDCHELLKSFVEMEVTWNDKSTGVAWAVAGLGSGTDYRAAMTSQADFYGPEYTVVVYDVASAVTAWLGAVRTNYGLLLQWLTVSSVIRDFASDDGIVPDHRPYFELLLA